MLNSAAMDIVQSLLTLGYSDTTGSVFRTCAEAKEAGKVEPGYNNRRER